MSIYIQEAFTVQFPRNTLGEKTDKQDCFHNWGAAMTKQDINMNRIMLGLGLGTIGIGLYDNGMS